MTIIWQVDDGYCCGQRTHETEIDDEELNDYETEEEKEEHINYCVQQDFLETVSWDELSRT